MKQKNSRSLNINPSAVEVDKWIRPNACYLIINIRVPFQTPRKQDNKRRLNISRVLQHSIRRDRRGIIGVMSRNIATFSSPEAQGKTKQSSPVVTLVLYLNIQSGDNRGWIGVRCIYSLSTCSNNLLSTYREEAMEGELHLCPLQTLISHFKIRDMIITAAKGYLRQLNLLFVNTPRSLSPFSYTRIQIISDFNIQHVSISVEKVQRMFIHVHES